MSYILGISAFYHDSAACLIRDGDIIAAAQEERFTRKKHDPGFPSQAAASCLLEPPLFGSHGAAITHRKVTQHPTHKPEVSFPSRDLEQYLTGASGIRGLTGCTKGPYSQALNY